jgi:hypothetical protein
MVKLCIALTLTSRIAPAPRSCPMPTPCIAATARAILALTSVTILSTAVAGCGATLQAQHPHAATGGEGASPNAVALKAVRTAAAATLRSSAAVELMLQGAQALGPSRAPAHGSGEFDFRAGAGRDAIDLGEIGHQEPGNEQILFLPARVYLQPKSFTTAVLPKGKEWVSVTRAGSNVVRTNFPAFAVQTEAIDPQLALSELAGGTVAATPIGQTAGETAVDGRARGYRVRVDLARALSAVSGPSRAALGEAIRSELAAGPGGPGARSPETSIEAWIAGGRVVRMRGAPPGADMGMITTTLCCFGSPVEVSLPPSGQVVDISALTPSGERENNGGGDSDGG